ncbi:hypothetical protein HDU67_000388, partial [Dinochytrium kinnereticum]
MEKSLKDPKEPQAWIVPQTKEAFELLFKAKKNAAVLTSRAKLLIAAAALDSQGSITSAGHVQALQLPFVESQILVFVFYPTANDLTSPISQVEIWPVKPSSLLSLRNQHLHNLRRMLDSNVKAKENEVLDAAWTQGVTETTASFASYAATIESIVKFLKFSSTMAKSRIGCIENSDAVGLLNTLAKNVGIRTIDGMGRNAQAAIQNARQLASVTLAVYDVTNHPNTEKLMSSLQEQTKSCVYYILVSLSPVKGSFRILMPALSFKQREELVVKLLTSSLEQYGDMIDQPTTDVGSLAKLLAFCTPNQSISQLDDLVQDLVMQPEISLQAVKALCKPFVVDTRIFAGAADSDAATTFLPHAKFFESLNRNIITGRCILQQVGDDKWRFMVEAIAGGHYFFDFTEDCDAIVRAALQLSYLLGCNKIKMLADHPGRDSKAGDNLRAVLTVLEATTEDTAVIFDWAALVPFEIQAINTSNSEASLTGQATNKSMTHTDTDSATSNKTQTSTQNNSVTKNVSQRNDNTTTISGGGSLGFGTLGLNNVGVNVNASHAKVSGVTRGQTQGLTTGKNDGESHGQTVSASSSSTTGKSTNVSSTATVSKNITLHPLSPTTFSILKDFLKKPRQHIISIVIASRTDITLESTLEELKWKSDPLPSPYQSDNTAKVIEPKSEQRLSGPSLYEAASKGDVDIIRKLAARGANLDEVTRLEDKLETALHAATRGNHVNLVHILADSGANLNGTEEQFESPMHIAAKLGFSTIIRLLLRGGAVVGLQNRYKETALHLASSSGNLDVVTALLKYDSPIDAMDSEKCTPLHRASEKGHIEVVKTLLAQGADPIARDWKEDTPLHYACLNGHPLIVSALVSEGNVDMGGEKKATPLHKASVGGHAAVVEILLLHGANLNVKDSENLTPQERAFTEGHYDVVAIFEAHLRKMAVKEHKARTRQETIAADPSPLPPKVGTQIDAKTWPEFLLRCRKCTSIIDSFSNVEIFMAIPSAVLDNAKGIAVLSMMNAGLIVSASGGSGLLFARLPDRSWSPPCPILALKATAGAHFGVTLTDLIITINTDKALVDMAEALSMPFGSVALRQSKSGNFEISAGPVGGKASASSLTGITPLFFYSKKSGFISGSSMPGTVITCDYDNQIYGHEMLVKDILLGAMTRPCGTENLYRALARLAPESPNA